MSSAEKVIDNFEYQIESVTPTSRIKAQRFTSWDPITGQEPSRSSFRKFWIDWTGSNEDVDATNRSFREAHHMFIVSVCYPTALSNKQLNKMMISDRHDIVKRLRDPQYNTGIEGSSSLDVGIMHRQRTGDEIDRKQYADLWIMQIEFDVKIRENES